MSPRAERIIDTRPLRLAARVGLVSNGVLHLLVAWLALRVAGGGRGRADYTGALQAIAAEPFGRAVVWLVVLAFVGTALWRLREACWGFPAAPDRAVKRLFAVGQIVVFVALIVLAVRVATGSPTGTGGESATAAVLRLPGGQWIVLAIGLGVLVVGVVIAVQGWREMFAVDLDLSRAGPLARGLVRWSGRVGAVARGAAMMIIGVLVGVAALSYQPARAEGLDAALKTLAAQPAGALALVAVALGLASYGVFCFLDARYHRV